VKGKGSPYKTPGEDRRKDNLFPAEGGKGTELLSVVRKHTGTRKEACRSRKAEKIKFPKDRIQWKKASPSKGGRQKIQMEKRLKSSTGWGNTTDKKREAACPIFAERGKVGGRSPTSREEGGRTGQEVEERRGV